MNEWYIIEANDEDGPVFEVWERVSWKKEQRGETGIEVMQGGSPVASVYKLEYAQEIVKSHNTMLT